MALPVAMKKYISLLMILTFASATITAQPKFTVKKQHLVFEAPPFQECHAATLVEVKDGKLLLSFFAGSKEGRPDVSIWSCFLDDSRNVDAKIVADGTSAGSTRYPAWNPVLFKSATGKITLFYKVGPNPRQWWGMYKTSTDGIHWSAPVALEKGILGPIKNKPVQLSNGTILSPSSVEETETRWKAHVEISKDDGASWTKTLIDTASSFNVIQPSILVHEKDKLQVLCRSREGNVITAWSNDKGESWGKLAKTELLNPNSGTDAITLANGKGYLIVYNPDIPGKEWFNNRGKLRVAYSEDGLKWRDIVDLEDTDGKEFSYPCIIQAADGLIHIAYTYDRKNIKHVVLNAL